VTESSGYVKPYRTVYRHLVCGTTTKMNHAMAELCARDPWLYWGARCAYCGKHLELTEFEWLDGEPMSPSRWPPEEHRAVLALRDAQSEDEDAESPEMAIDVFEATVLRLEPGDALVISSKALLSAEGIEKLRTLVDQALPGTRCLVLQSGLDLSVVRPAPVDVPLAWDCAAESEKDRGGRESSENGEK
jgi:hypothetical protein